jgi:PilZ domain
MIEHRLRVPMTKPTTSRRRAPRLPIHLEGSLSGRVPRRVTVVDVSLTGCLVQCGSLLDPGAILDLKLALDPDPLAAKVRVADSYVDGGAAPAESPRYLAGLEFLSLPAREATRLRRFLDEERRRRRSADGPSH